MAEFFVGGQQITFTSALFSCGSLIVHCTKESSLFRRYRGSFLSTLSIILASLPLAKPSWRLIIVQVVLVVVLTLTGAICTILVSRCGSPSAVLSSSNLCNPPLAHISTHKVSPEFAFFDFDCPGLHYPHRHQLAVETTLSFPLQRISLTA
jgi:hypothetical protein